MCWPGGLPWVGIEWDSPVCPYGEIRHAESFPQLCGHPPDFPILLPCLFYCIHFGLYETRPHVAPAWLMLALSVLSSGGCPRTVSSLSLLSKWWITDYRPVPSCLALSPFIYDPFFGKYRSLSLPAHRSMYLAYVYVNKYFDIFQYPYRKLICFDIWMIGVVFKDIGCWDMHLILTVTSKAI